MGKESACDTGDAGSIPPSDPLKEEMVNHSGILAWKIQWTEDPGEPQSMGSQRVEHNPVTEHAHTTGSELILLLKYLVLLT